MKRWYFGYGMNTNLDGMRQRCPKAICHGAAVLLNHKFVFRYHADIEECPGSRVYGVLWSITEECERSLDMLEGYPYYYNKKEVIVENTHPLMNRHVAMVYFMNDQNSINLPGDIYLNSLLEGYKENSVNTEQIYLALEQCRKNEETC